jgi:hypothetical protein
MTTSIVIADFANMRRTETGEHFREFCNSLNI